HSATPLAQLFGGGERDGYSVGLRTSKVGIAGRNDRAARLSSGRPNTRPSRCRRAALHSACGSIRGFQRSEVQRARGWGWVSPRPELRRAERREGGAEPGRGSGAAGGEGDGQGRGPAGGR